MKRQIITVIAAIWVMLVALPMAHADDSVQTSDLVQQSDDNQTPVTAQPPELVQQSDSANQTSASVQQSDSANQTSATIQQPDSANQTSASVQQSDSANQTSATIQQPDSANQAPVTAQSPALTQPSTPAQQPDSGVQIQALALQSDAGVQAHAALQISSNISDGSHSIADIVEIAKRRGIDIVLMADRDLMRWQYGLWPLRRVIKITVENNSVFRYGITRYLQDIAAAQKSHPDMIVLGGIESAPFYYWKEDAANRRLTIKNWHKHLLVVGLDNPQDIRRLPVTGNVAGLALPCGLGCFGYFIFPLLAFAAGVYFITDKRFGYARFHRVLINTGNRKARIFGIIFIAFGVALLTYGYPYRDLKFDQFRGDLGIMPYQNFIDYVNDKGGMTFWVHPEAENIENTPWADIMTPEHSEALLQSRDYTGFSIFYNGYERVGKPGGIWDRILNEYCDGLRTSPIWAIGSLCIDRTCNLVKEFEGLRTIFLLESLDKRSVLNALKNGYCYVTQGKNAPRFILDAFAVSDPASGGSRTMGQELESAAAPVIKIAGHFRDLKARQVKVLLIRNGMAIKTFEVPSPFDISYQDEFSTDRARSYYRVEIRSDGVLLVTNPIFVRNS